LTPVLIPISRLVGYAEKVVLATRRERPDVLDVLAAAYAETGQFEKAIVTEKEAISHVQQELVKRSFETRLELYRCHVPYRDIITD
jgi:hypothetical protein